MNRNYNYYADVIINDNARRMYALKYRLAELVRKMKEENMIPKNYKLHFCESCLTVPTEIYDPKHPKTAKQMIEDRNTVFWLDHPRKYP